MGHGKILSAPGTKKPRAFDRGSLERRTAGFPRIRQQKPFAGVSPPAGGERKSNPFLERLCRPQKHFSQKFPRPFQRNRGGIFVQLPQKMAGPFFEVNASRPVSRVLSFKTAIYLDAPLPTRSSRLPGTAGPAYCPSTALLRIEFTAMGCSQPSGELLPHLSTFSGQTAGSLFLLHFS